MTEFHFRDEAAFTSGRGIDWVALEAFVNAMSRGGAERAEKIVKNEHCNWASAVTAAPRDQVFQLYNLFQSFPRDSV